MRANLSVPQPAVQCDERHANHLCGFRGGEGLLQGQSRSEHVVITSQNEGKVEYARKSVTSGANPSVHDQRAQ